MYGEEEMNGTKGRAGASAGSTSLMALLTREEKFLINRSGRLSQETLKQIEAGELSFVDTSVYKATIINTSKLTELFGTNPSDRYVGVTNIDKGVMHFDLAAVGLKITYGSAANTVTDPSLVKMTNIGEGTDFPAALLNGEVEFLINQKKVFPGVPLSNFFAWAKNAGSTAIDAKGQLVFKLRALKLIKKGDKVEVNIRLGDGATSSNSALDPAVNHFVRAEVVGLSIQ